MLGTTVKLNVFEFCATASLSLAYVAHSPLFIINADLALIAHVFATILVSAGWKRLCRCVNVYGDDDVGNASRMRVKRRSWKKKLWFSSSGLMHVCVSRSDGIVKKFIRLEMVGWCLAVKRVRSEYKKNPAQCWFMKRLFLWNFWFIK